MKQMKRQSLFSLKTTTLMAKVGPQTCKIGQHTVPSRWNSQTLTKHRKKNCWGFWKTWPLQIQQERSKHKYICSKSYWIKSTWQPSPHTEHNTRTNCEGITGHSSRHFGTNNGLRHRKLPKILHFRTSFAKLLLKTNSKGLFPKTLFPFSEIISLTKSFFSKMLSLFWCHIFCFKRWTQFLWVCLSGGNLLQHS